MSEQTVTFNLEINTEQAIGNARHLETVFFRALSLAQRLGLPENIDAAIGKVQQLTMTVRLMHSAIIAMEAATPYGWAMALLSVSGTALTVGAITHDTMGEIQGR